ncbi:MAG: hypothetical protein QOF49_833 [Chloroflexota bacterium]|jgi:hypothetical protein|nr:hypothetical protein [Chloroflexota bacterium]
MTARSAAAVVVLVASLVAGCNHAIFGPDYSVTVENDATIPVNLVVNEKAVTVILPGNGAIIHAGEMPGLPWRLALTTAGGRTLVTLPVADGSIVDERAADGTGSYSAPATRIDLSCGSIGLYAGDATPRGPAPGPGTPGDCDP